MLDIRDFQLTKILGRSNNIVKHGINIKTKEEVAVKCIKFPKGDDKILQEVVNEATMLSKCKHQNIVKFYGYSIEEKYDEM